MSHTSNESNDSQIETHEAFSGETRFGFLSTRNSAHMARTMMLSELTHLFASMENPDAPRAEYRQAIVDMNCLAKRSRIARALTFRHLTELYALDTGVTLFRALRFFWSGDALGRPLLALLCASARDSLLRATWPFILSVPEGEAMTRLAMESFVDTLEPNRFSKVTLSSVAKNINSTWTQSGYLAGRAVKHRTRVKPTPGALAYALLLGYLQGARGELLFQSEHMRMLECAPELAVDLAESAARRGWLIFKHVGNVMDVSFPELLTPQEVEWSRE